MKKKLFIAMAAFAAAVCMPAQAQTAQGWTTGAEVGGGDFYLYNTGTQQYLAPGYSSWGTEAWSMPHARSLTLSANGEGYNIYTGLSNPKKTSYYYLVDTWMDGAATAWTFAKLDDGAYTISNSTGYLAATSGANAVLANASDATTNNEWLLITKDMITSAMTSLTYDGSTYVDATPFITCPDVVRNDLVSFKSSWTMASGSCSVGGSDADQCAEIYDQTYDMYQTLTDMPNGTYIVRVQGFYRPGYDGTTETTKNAIFYANESETELMLLSEGTNTTCNNMSAVSAAFIEGDFSSNSVKVIVTDGTLKIGLKKTNQIDGDWTIFDNFSLEYYGKVIASEAQELPSDGSLAADTWYKYTVTVDGDYTLTASDISNVVYTTDGSQALTSYEATTASGTLMLTAGTYYFKSSSAQTLSITAATKAYIVGDATITPTDGTYLTSLTTVTIAYPDATTNDDDASFAILNASGVTCGDKTATLSLDGTTLTATFDGLTIDLNGSATVAIAAGTVGYAGQTTNEAASVTYKNGNIAEGTYFFQVNDEYRFITSGGNWATEATVNEYGAPWTVELADDGTYYLLNAAYNAAGGTTLGITGTSSLYTDQAGSKFTFEAGSTDGTYYIVNADGNYLCSATEGTYGYNYLTATSGKDSAIEWKLLTREEYDAAVEEKKNAEVTALGLSDASTTEELEALLVNYNTTELTSSISNPTYAASDGWTCEAINPGGRYVGAEGVSYTMSSNNCAEIWAGNGKFYQTLSGLDAGIYKVTVNAFQRPGTSDSGTNASGVFTPTAYLYAESGDVCNVTQLQDWATVGITAVDGTSSFAENASSYPNEVYVNVDEDGELTIGIMAVGYYNGSWVAATNWTLTKYALPTVDITEAGALEENGTTYYYATYSTPAAVDLRQCEFEAYSVTTSGTDLTYTQQKDIVPAGTALVIRGTEAKTYEVAVTTSESTAIESNDLKVADGTTTGDGSTIYILANGSQGLGWYICTDGSTIKEGKCYLTIASSNEAKFIGIGDVASGIAGVTTSQSSTSARYNLSGQRVDGSYKGIVIENGKKYLLK